MPSYMYLCPNEECEYHTFEMWKDHSMKDCDLRHDCPLCKQPMYRKIQSTFLKSDKPAKPETIKIKA